MNKYSLNGCATANSQIFVFLLSVYTAPSIHTASPSAANSVLEIKCWNLINDMCFFCSKISETTEIKSPSNKAYSSGTTFKRKVESQKVQSEVVCL